MDILESILRTSNAETYLETFREQGVDVSVLPLLNDDDLSLLGIADKEIRKKILNQAKNLQIRTEKQIDCTVNKEYIQLVINQINAQLNLHKANLACGLRNDTIICDIKLTKSLICLLTCLNSFDRRVKSLNKKIMPPKSRGNRRKKIKIFCASASAVVFLYLTFKFWK